MSDNSVSIDGELKTSYSITDATLYPKKISANTKLGFSTVLFTGTGDSNNKVPHGLGVAPELIMYKNIDEARSWVVGTDGIGWSNTLKLDDATALGDRAYFDDVRPTSNVFEIYNGQANTANDSGSDFIAYCFASKRGVSKVGSYTGGTTNEIYTGFEPAFLLVKRTNASGDDWHMFDSTRGGGAKFDEFLKANTADAEGSSSNREVTFNRNGFKWSATTSNAVNTSGNTYIYYAVAKSTNETDLIDDTDLELHLDADSFDGSTNTPSTWTALTGSNGTISGATFDSELGNYLDFDGSNDYISVPSTSSTPVDFSAKNYTIEAWIKPNTASASTDPILSKYGTTDSLRSINFNYASNGKLRLFERATGTDVSHDSTSTLTLNRWTHVAVTRTSSQVKLYIDGSLDNTISSTFTPNNGGSQNINIGSQANGQYNFFDGQIGQVRIYSSALTQDQIRQNFNFTKPNYPNGFDGTITGATFHPDGYFDFDGSTNDVTIKTIDMFHGDFTLSMWWKLDSLSGYQMLFGLQGYGDSSQSGFGHYINGSTIHTWAQIPSSSVEIGRSGNILSTGVWHHIVLVREGSTWKHYLDGDLESTYTNKTTIAMNSQNGKIGEHYNNSGYNTDGKCSKVKVYDRALSDSEITDLYNEGE